jgi:hypothetical protein
MTTAPTSYALDKNRPYKSVKDFSTNRTTFVQDGRSYSEQGFPLIVANHDSSVKYLCPQCDFRTAKPDHLYDHSERIHAAGDVQLAVLKTYVQNIDRCLPGDEGIDWARMKVTRTSAQKAFDEQEAVALEPKPDADPLACGLCPTLKPFASKNLLATHRWHKHKLRREK